MYTGYNTQKPVAGVALNKRHGLTESLVGCWLMSSGGTTVPDASRNRLHGTASGTYEWRPGRFGRAFWGNGVSNQIVVTSNQTAGGLLNPAHVTVLSWIKTTTGVQDQDIASLWKAGDAGDQSYLLWIDQPVFEFIIRTAGGSYTVNSSNVQAGIWQQVVGTYDGQTAKLYINGRQVAQNTSPSGDLLTCNESNLFYISERAPGTSTNFEFLGSIDHVMVFNRALLPVEIRYLYQNPFCMFQQDIIRGKTPAAPPAGNAGIMTTNTGFWGPTF